MHRLGRGAPARRDGGVDAGNRGRAGAGGRCRRLYRPAAQPRPGSVGSRDRNRRGRGPARQPDPRLAKTAEHRMPVKPHDLPLAPAHPDLQIVEEKIGFARHLRLDVVRFRHRLFAGGWSGERVFDVVRRGGAAAILLYDPDRDSVVLVEQFRLAALYAGLSPWQLECVAGLIEPGESAEAVAVRETREEANLQVIVSLEAIP